MRILQTIDLKKYYGTEPNITRALDGVNFSVNDGEFVAVVGTSGSGKSTLLHMMGGLDTPTSGNVIVRDKELSKMNDEQLTIFRRRNIGFIFQNYNLVPIVKNEGRKLGSIGILIGTVLGVCGGFLLFSKGFNAVSYVATVILTLISSWIMVSVSIRKPVKIAAGISPIEAVRFTPAQKDIRSRKKNIKLNPVSMGIANFRRDRKKTVAIVASLSLGGIILLVVSSIVLLRSPEALARQFFPDGDYKIYLDGAVSRVRCGVCILHGKV